MISAELAQKFQKIGRLPLSPVHNGFYHIDLPRLLMSDESDVPSDCKIQHLEVLSAYAIAFSVLNAIVSQHDRDKAESRHAFRELTCSLQGDDGELFRELGKRLHPEKTFIDLWIFPERDRDFNLAQVEKASPFARAIERGRRTSEGYPSNPRG